MIFARIAAGIVGFFLTIGQIAGSLRDFDSAFSMFLSLVGVVIGGAIAWAICDRKQGPPTLTRLFIGALIGVFACHLAMMAIVSAAAGGSANIQVWGLMGTAFGQWLILSAGAAAVLFSLFPSAARFTSAQLKSKPSAITSCGDNETSGSSTGAGEAQSAIPSRLQKSDQGISSRSESLVPKEAADATASNDIRQGNVQFVPGTDWTVADRETIKSAPSRSRHAEISDPVEEANHKPHTTHPRPPATVPATSEMQSTVDESDESGLFHLDSRPPRPEQQNAHVTSPSQSQGSTGMNKTIVICVAMLSIATLAVVGINGLTRRYVTQNAGDGRVYKVDRLTGESFLLVRDQELPTVNPNPPAKETAGDKAIRLAKKGNTLHGYSIDNESRIRESLQEMKGEIHVIGWEAKRINDQTYLVTYSYLPGSSWLSSYWAFEVNLEVGIVRNVNGDASLEARYTDDLVEMLTAAEMRPG